MCFRTKISCIPRRSKGFANLLWINFVPKKFNPTKTVHQLSKRGVLTGKIGKAYKLRNFSCLTQLMKFPPFFQNEGLIPKEPNAILFRHGNQFFRGCHVRDALTTQATFSQLAETK